MNKRAKDNTNLKLTYESTFKGKDIYQSSDGLVINYLESIDTVFTNAFNDYGRLIVVRIDLRYPNRPDVFHQEGDIGDFFKKLDYQFKVERTRRMKSYGRGHSCVLRGFWCIEQDSSSNPHYHVVLVLHEAFFGCLGQFKGNTRSLSHFIRLAWARVLGVSLSELGGVVEFPDNGTYRIKRSDSHDCPVFQAMYYRVSYLAKLKTKHYGDYKKSFGASRK